MAKIQWYGTVEQMNRRIVREVSGIKVSVREKAESIHAKAEVLLAPHHARNAPRRDPGDSISRLSVESGIVDSYVVLTDEDGGAAAIEKFLAPMSRAAGLEAGGA